MPVPFALALLISAATLIHAALALASPSPWIIPDEIIYADLGKSLGAGGLPRIRDELSFEWGLGYPLLQAPVWAMFGDVPTAYAVLKGVNALVLSLTAVPALLLARRFVDERHALVVAALTVTVPSMFYAGTLMTEVAVYPTFVLALLAMSSALVRPTLGTQSAALAALALAFAVKTLAVALVAGYIVAILLYHWLETREAEAWRVRLRAYQPTALFVAGALLVAITGLVVSGRRPWDVLGTYAVVLDYLDVAAVPRWILIHLAALDIYLAVIPFAATALVVAHGLRSTSSREQRLFAAMAIPVIAMLLVAVGAFASVPFPDELRYPENITRLHERSVFWITPLFLIGTMIWLRERPGGRRALLAAVGGAVLLPVVIPSDLVARNQSFQAFALDPWRALKDDIGWPIACLAFTVVLGALFVRAHWREMRAAVFLVPVVYWSALVSVTAHSSTSEVSRRPQTRRGAPSRPGSMRLWAMTRRSLCSGPKSRVSHSSTCCPGITLSS